jgi:hypothetical protein
MINFGFVGTYRRFGELVSISEQENGINDEIFLEKAILSCCFSALFLSKSLYIYSRFSFTHIPPFLTILHSSILVHVMCFEYHWSDVLHATLFEIS